MKRYTCRPLPSYAHRPGTTPHPERHPGGHMVAMSPSPARPLRELEWSVNEDYLFAFDLYNAAFFWEAHVYWEKLWALDTTDDSARPLLRGLIQLAAASLKTGKGRRKLLERSRRSLDGLSFLYGVDVDSLRGVLDRKELPTSIELRFDER